MHLLGLNLDRARVNLALHRRVRRLLILGLYAPVFGLRAYSCRDRAIRLLGNSPTLE